MDNEWVMVPRKSTQKMYDAGFEYWIYCERNKLPFNGRGLWNAMVFAAPEAPEFIDGVVILGIDEYKERLKHAASHAARAVQQQSFDILHKYPYEKNEARLCAIHVGTLINEAVESTMLISPHPIVSKTE